MKILLILDIILITYRLLKRRYLKNLNLGEQLKYQYGISSTIDALLGMLTVILIVTTLVVFVITMF